MQREQINDDLPERQTCGQLLDWVDREVGELALELVVDVYGADLSMLPCAHALSIYWFAGLLKYAANYDNYVEPYRLRRQKRRR